MLEDDSQLFSWEVLIPEGDWEYKVVLNENWDQDTYGGGANFTVNSNGINETVFYYDFKQNSTYYEVLENCLGGDINGDSVLNILDIVGIVSYILNNNIFNECQLQSADINMDENINILDVVGIVNMILTL